MARKRKSEPVIESEHNTEIRAVTLNEHRSDIGIHLLDPSIEEIQDAICRAERVSFSEIVWCHYSNVVTLK